MPDKGTAVPSSIIVGVRNIENNSTMCHRLIIPTLALVMPTHAYMSHPLAIMKYY